VAFTLTLFYSGLLGLILLGLSMQVVRLRRRLGVGIGSGDQPELERAIRAQANFCEYAPLGILLLLVLEGSAALHPTVLHVLGIALVIGRIMHGFMGLNRSAGVSSGRFIGTLITWLMILLSSLLAVWVAVGRWLTV
jgi:uncharacterized membrane protein YecN with MAPEG domain